MLRTLIFALAASTAFATPAIAQTKDFPGIHFK